MNTLVPKFKYLTKIKVLHGFYEGLTGCLLAYYPYNGVIRYLVQNIDNKTIQFEINENEIIEFKG